MALKSVAPKVDWSSQVSQIQTNVCDYSIMSVIFKKLVRPDRYSLYCFAIRDIGQEQQIIFKRINNVLSFEQKIQFVSVSVTPSIHPIIILAGKPFHF